MSESNAPRRSTKGKIALIALAVVVVIALAAYWLTADYRAYSRAVALQDAGDHSWTVPQATDKGKKWPPVVE